MKNIISTVVVVMGLGFASIAMAAPTAYVDNIKISQDGTGTGVDGTCALLNETVKIGVSANVNGAFECDETNGIINVAACHEGGTRAPIKCAYTVDANGDTTTTWNAAGCDTVGGDSTDPDYTAFTASSRGGVMLGIALGDRCTSSSLTGLDFWTE
ncbi:MAG: hypothetical protein ABFS08_00405 [Pseudomonadota bacterium]